VKTWSIRGSYKSTIRIRFRVLFSLIKHGLRKCIFFIYANVSKRVFLFDFVQFSTSVGRYLYTIIRLTQNTIHSTATVLCITYKNIIICRRRKIRKIINSQQYCLFKIVPIPISVLRWIYDYFGTKTNYLTILNTRHTDYSIACFYYLLVVLPIVPTSIIL